MRTGLAAALLALAVAPLAGQERAPQSESIRQEHMRPDVFFLASDDMGGRLTGTPGNDIATEFVASRFERLGLRPIAPGNSYYHTYTLTIARLGRGNVLGVAHAGGASLRLEPPQDFYPQRFSASATAKAPVVFAGFGITAPALGYDDFTGDLAGRIVLVLDHEPGERDPASPFDGVVPTVASRHPVHKALYAQERGAVGILYVSDLHNHAGPENFDAVATGYWPATPPRIERFELASWVERVRIPALQISQSLARQIVRTSGRSLEELARASETATGLAPIPLPGIEIEITAAVERHTLVDRSVVGLVEGADPQLRDEWIVISAHHDHNGADASGVYAGADDNASAVAGLLEIAEAYALAAREGRRPKRSVMLVSWNSEERGLTGSFAFTEQPFHPLDRIAAVINMDMIGRNEEVPVGGGSRFRGLEVQTAESNSNAVNLIGYSHSPDLVALVEGANKAYGLELKKRYDNSSSELYRRSDHWPFLQRQVPAIWFHTGLHPDYHTIYDRPERLNYAKAEKIVRLVYQVSWELAQQPGRPRFVPRAPLAPSSAAR